MVVYPLDEGRRFLITKIKPELRKHWQLIAASADFILPGRHCSSVAEAA